MQQKRLIAAAAAALLAGFGQDAEASAAQASLANFRVQLIDLDPADGIAPSITFEQLDGGTFVAAESGQPGLPLTDVQQGGSVFGNASASSARDGAAGSASISGDPQGAGADVAVSVSSTLAGTYAAGTVWLGDGADYVAFTLSPETRLVISGDATASATSSFDDASADAWSSVLLKLTDYTGENGVSMDTVQAESAGVGSAGAGTQVDARHLEVSFENATTDSAGGIFFGSLDASVTDSASSVPEPAGAALLAAGLGLLAWCRARARSR